MGDLPDQSIAINRLHFPVTALGPGRRVGVWLQGCSIRCSGCISLDTWDSDPATTTQVNDVVDWIVRQDANGITISGGEPFDQPDALRSLITRVRRRATDLSMGILVYSGHPLGRLTAYFTETLALIDVLISGPYVAGDTPHQPLVGSDNQVITYFNVSMEALFKEYLEASERATPFQVQATSEGIWLIGVPQPGDMERMRSDLTKSGIELEEMSWRT